MKQQEVFRKTGAIIKELNEQYEYLQSTADELNDLELELFVANTHFLKDHAEILRKLNLQKLEVQHTLPPHVEEPTPEAKAPVIEEPKTLVIPETKKPANGEPKYFEPLVQQAKPVIERPPFTLPAKAGQPEPEQQQIPQAKEEQPAPQIDLHTGNDKDSYSFEREEPETIRHELVIDEAETPDEEEDIPVLVEDKTGEKPVITMEGILNDEPKAADETQKPHIVSTNPEPVIDNTPKTTAAQPEPVKEEKVLTLNQKMSAQLRGEATVQAEPAEAPIKDIKTAISLNDKLLFVKDLFNGYSLAYSEAIEIVNRFSNFEEADRFLKTNYVTKNNWEGKKATSDKFYALLKRRYA